MANARAADSIKAKTFYSIEAPGVLRSNTRYDVVVSIFEAEELCAIQITLYGGEYRVEQIVDVSPMSTKTVSFEVPDLCAKKDYFLEAKGLKGIEFSECINLRFKEGKPLTYIQCDKQAYKRGDNVDFRIFILDGNVLKPALLKKPINIKIKLLDDILVEIENVELDRGVYNNKWLIPTDAVHGNYDIEVYAGDAFLALKSFEIIDYTAPKIDIRIKTAKEVLYTDKQLLVKIEANHMDGSPFEGNCALEITSVAGYFSGVHIEKLLKISSGNSEVTVIDLVEDLDIDNSFMDHDWFTTASIMIRASVTTDDDAKIEENLTSLVTVKKTIAVTEDESRSCGNSCGNACGMVFEEDADTENEFLNIKVNNNKDIKIGDMLDFSLTLKHPANYCIYFVIARGNIVKTELINVEDNSEPIKRSLDITFVHVPRAFILAYYIYEGVLYFNEIGINLERDFENKLEVLLPEKSMPGETIPIKIKSSPNSLIAFMAVDHKSVVLNAKNDLQPKQIFNDLFHLRSQTPKVKGSGIYPGLAPGLVTLTNAEINGLSFDDDDNEGFCRLLDREHFHIESRMPRIDVEARKKDIVRALQERNQVFGNWVFCNKETDQNGELEMELTLPDNSTTWLCSILAIGAEKGFTMTKNPLKIISIGAELPANDDDIERFITKSEVTEFVVDHYENEASRHTLFIESHENREPIEVTFCIMENLYGPLIADLAEYAGIMYCTGHLHMTTMIPNIDVLEYLESLNLLDSEFAVSIKKRFHEAIERELSERRVEDGSFSWFAKDHSGSPHVTSLVLQAFQRAAKFVPIDPTVIERGLNYLAYLQTETGEILKEQDPYKYPFEKDIGVGLTSMVLLAFLQAEEITEKFRSTIDKGFEYIVANIETVNCVYDLALSFYVMQLAKHSYADILKARLFEIAKRDDEKNHVWWTYSLVSDSDPDVYYPISDLEVTSYILLGLLETESIETMLPIVKWILPLQGLGNETMDCAVALNAVLKMAVKSGAALGKMSVEYTALATDNERNGKIELNPENATKVQVHVLPKDTQRIEFSTAEKGTFFGKLVYRYIDLK